MALHYNVPPPSVSSSRASIADAHANYLALYLTLTATQRRVLAGMAALRRPECRRGQPTAAAIGVAASTYRTARQSSVVQ